MKWHGDVLALRNDDAAEWRDVEIAIYGFKTNKSLTGRYTHHVDRIPANSLHGVPLDDFTNATGARWVSMTMQVESVDVKATRLDSLCKSQDLKLGKDN